MEFEFGHCITASLRGTMGKKSLHGWRFRLDGIKHGLGWGSGVELVCVVHLRAMRRIK